MANENSSDTIVLAAGGTPLKASLKRAMRRDRIRAFLLVVPLFLFILFSFLTILHFHPNTLRYLRDNGDILQI